jgi:hypothetical protein
MKDCNSLESISRAQSEHAKAEGFVLNPNEMIDEIDDDMVYIIFISNKKHPTMSCGIIGNKE